MRAVGNLQVVPADRRIQSQITLYRVVAALCGVVAVGLVLTDAVPLLSAFVYIVYGFVIPAVALRAHLAKGMSTFESPASAIWLIPALLPLWVVLVSLLWASSNSLSGMQVAGTLAVIVVNMTYLLVWRAPLGAQLNLRAAAERYGPGAIMFTSGLALGALLVFVIGLVG